MFCVYYYLSYCLYIFSEGFLELKKIASQQPWPKSPKFIFTSNNFNTDEIFKIWTATKIQSGSKYYVGQHGNNYYTKKIYFPNYRGKNN